MMQESIKILKQFDKDGDGYLNAAERKAARAYLQTENPGGRGRRGFGPGGPRGFGGRGESTQEKPVPGPQVTPAEVKSYPDAPAYDPLILRTFFLQFEEADWEKELAEFHGTDVDVPARLTVDGRTYKQVGVHFRGMSSYMMVGEGSKRSLNLALGYVHKNQNIGGYRTFNLLNSHEDPTYLRSVLSYQVDRAYIPAPKANYVRLVINGELWGIYVCVQQFDKDLVKDWFDTTKGARWKVRGSPGGQGSLAYLGDDPTPYKQIYTIKSKDDPKAWADLIHLCKVLNETPTNQLEQALAPCLDIDGALRFIALDNALINNDGYWIRTSDYALYEDSNGRFHPIPQDSNETFSRPEGPGFGGGRGGGRRGGFGGGPGGFGPRGPGGGPDGGFGGGPGGGFGRRGRGPGGRFGGGAPINGIELDPLYAASDESKPLISKLLAVPALRAKYLGYVRDIAEHWLDWQKLGPIAEQYQNLIAEDIKKDTRKLDPTEAFFKGLTNDIEGTGFGPSGGGTIGLKSFADQRRRYLLEHTEIKKAGL
jgi:hypothetical protein